MYRIETEDLARKVYKTLKDMILNGDLRSGMKLIQDELAERLGVSRTPLLLAISKLEQENLIETLPRRGAYVRRYGQKDLIDIYDIRSRLEPLAARDAAVNASAEAIAALGSCVEAFDSAVKSGDAKEIKRTDYEFHMELLHCCSNRFLFDMLTTIALIVVSNTKGLLKPAERSLDEHHRLLDAIRAHDPDTAERVMFTHMNDSRMNLMASAEYLLDPDAP